MIQLAQMTQLVNNHIVAELRRKHSQAPIQLNAPFCIAAAPARLKITERNIVRRQTYPARKGMNRFVKNPTARIFKIAAHDLTAFQKKSAAFFHVFRGTIVNRSFHSRIQETNALPHRSIPRRSGILFGDFRLHPMPLLLYKPANLLFRHTIRRPDRNAPAANGQS